MKHIGKISILVCIILIVIYNGIGIFFTREIPPLPPSHTIYDTKGQILGQTVAEGSYRSLPILYDEYPSFLIDAVINLEDRRFYYHRGVDLYGLTRALWNNLTTDRREGASTIEAQLIRNRFWLNDARSLSKKLYEFLLAKGLNFRYSKREILSQYLAGVNFGYLNFGFAQGSLFYFDKPLSQLTKGEMLALIAMMKNPNIYDPFKHPDALQKRYLRLVGVLRDKGILSEEDALLMREEKITFAKHPHNTLPYVSDFLEEHVPLKDDRIMTTIDLHLSNTVDELARASIKGLAWKNVSDYGILIVDRESMQLKVMIGGANYHAKDGQVNSTLALRQPGSSLKPHIYALAFQDLKKNPSSTILDLPISYPTKDGYSYQPKNYSLDYAGEVSLAEALSQSINIPAVKLLDEISVEKYMDFLKTIGITSLTQDKDYYGLSLALGSGEVSLYELLQSYSIYAHDGDYCLIRVLTDEPKTCQRVIEKQYSDMVVSILSNRFIKLPGFPIHSNLDFPDRAVFVKTGTSRNFNDNWAIGFTKRYMIGVWVGNKDGSEMKGVSGATGAGDIFNKIVYQLEPQIDQQIPQTIAKDSQSFLSITSPLANTTFTNNPSIPQKNQEIKLAFTSNIAYTSAHWILNGQSLSGSYIPLSSLSQNNYLSLRLMQNQTIIKEQSIDFYYQK